MQKGEHGFLLSRTDVRAKRGSLKKSRYVIGCEIFIRKINATDSSFQRKLESSVFHALQVTGSQLSLGWRDMKTSWSVAIFPRPQSAFAGMTASWSI